MIPRDNKLLKQEIFAKPSKILAPKGIVIKSYSSS